MTAIEELPTTVEAREELSLQARIALCRMLFLAFLQFVRIEDEAAKASGVPGGIVPLEMWPHIVRMAYQWAEGGHHIVLKARQIGISILLASYAAWVAGIRGQRVLVISKTKADAVELAERIRVILRNLPDELRPRVLVDNKQELRFTNGGHIVILAPTETAGRSFTASVVIVDEAAFHPYAAQNYAAYEPTVARTQGQILMVSTANGSSNFFAKTFMKAWQGGGQFTAHFLPWWLTPDRQLPDGKPNYEWRDSKKDDYDEAAMFLAEYAGSIEEAFTTKAGLVYGVDVLGRHIFKRQPFTSPDREDCGNLSPDPVPWNDCAYHLWSLDPGGGDPTALGFYGVLPNGRIHKYGEWHQDTGAVPFQDIIPILAEWEPERGWALGLYDAPEDNVATIAAMGYNVRRPRKDRKEGLDMTTGMLLSRRLTFKAEKCPHTLMEFGSYVWAETTDSTTKQRYRTATPVDHHGDHMDEMRYVCMAVHNGDMLAENRQQRRKAYGGVQW